MNCPAPERLLFNPIQLADSVWPWGKAPVHIVAWNWLPSFLFNFATRSLQWEQDTQAALMVRITVRLLTLEVEVACYILRPYMKEITPSYHPDGFLLDWFP